MKTVYRYPLLCILLTTVCSWTVAEAQILPGAQQRRAERSARQLQRQVSRADYYAPQAWQPLDPWIRQNGVAPLARAANAASATAEAVEQTADAATRRGDGQFGYRDNSQQNTWFYDYYTYTPTYYMGGTDDRYAGAIRYFDADGDGVFDSHSYYRDSDNDGRYDEFDRHDFYSQAAGDTNVAVNAEVRVTADSDTALYQGPQDARRHRVQGEIASTKLAQVNGSRNLLVGISGTSENTLAIDLGPAEALKGFNVEVGRSIVAIGAMERIGEKDLLVADRVQIDDGKIIEISRDAGLSITGQIVDIKSTRIDANDHYIAIVDVDGERQLVDLGPTATYTVRLEPATQVTVVGMPVRTQDHRVILANQVRVGDEVIEIDHTQRFTR